MSVDESAIIDFIGVDVPTGNVILTIADHLEWDEEGIHILTLAAKMQYYLTVVETGTLVENYPDMANRGIEIHVSMKYAPNKDGINFLEQMTEQFLKRSYILKYQKLEW